MGGIATAGSGDSTGSGSPWSHVHIQANSSSSHHVAPAMLPGSPIDQAVTSLSEGKGVASAASTSVALLYAVFLARLLAHVLPNWRMFAKRSARRHRLAGLAMLAWLLLGLIDALRVRSFCGYRHVRAIG